MIDKIIEALRIAVIADTGCTLTAEQCDRLIDALALKDEALAKYKPIPVSERMPDETEWVLIYDMLQERWVSGMFIHLGGGGLQWATIDGYYFHGDNFSRVTHWMPLPPAPEASHD